MIDSSADWHTHSDLTDGTASPEAMADAAWASGLRSWALTDHVRRDSDWVPEYIQRVRALRRDGLTVLCGIEAKILDARGAIDMPGKLAGLDTVLVADHQYPGADGPVHPRDMAQRIASGAVSAQAAVDGLVAATCRALELSPFRPTAVHPFSLLPKMGLGEELVTDEHVGALAAACLASGGSVEVNEKWRCPSIRVVRALAAAGVPLVAGSDAHAVADVARWDHVETAARAVAAG
jgi:putative hydrolase